MWVNLGLLLPMPASLECCGPVTYGPSLMWSSWRGGRWSLTTRNLSRRTTPSSTDR